MRSGHDRRGRSRRDLHRRADAGNTNDVQLTRPAANGVPLFLAAGDGVAIGPGDIFLADQPQGHRRHRRHRRPHPRRQQRRGTGVTYKVIIIGRTVAA
jgi:hypothetical protein